MSLLAGKKNRKLAQRRPLRERLPAPGLVVRAMGRGLRRALPALAVSAALAGIGFGVYAGYRWLRTSPRFAVSAVEIEGNHRRSAAELGATAGVPLGSNVFGVDLDQVEAAVARDPWVVRAEARRSLPSTIVVSVVERQAAAVLSVDDGAGEASLYLADAQGAPFKRADLAAGEATGLLVISGIDRALFRDQPAAAASLVRHALWVARTWNGQGARPALGEIRLDRDGVTLYTLEGATAIRLGRAAEARGGRTSSLDLHQRLRRFDAAWRALSEEERKAARTIHLDNLARPDRVTVALDTPNHAPIAR